MVWSLYVGIGCGVALLVLGIAWWDRDQIAAAEALDLEDAADQAQFLAGLLLVVLFLPLLWMPYLAWRLHRSGRPG